jgi:hypothetical protein
MGSPRLGTRAPPSDVTGVVGGIESRSRVQQGDRRPPALAFVRSVTKGGSTRDWGLTLEEEDDGRFEVVSPMHKTAASR